MRSKFVGIAVVCVVAFAARAEDTKPPGIADVKASAKGGKVTVEARITDETGVLSAICHHRSPGGAVDDSPMTKDDYDDVFKVTFPGGPDSEYWIESSDLLGNGPALYGTQAKPYTANGKPSTGKAVAQAEPPAPRGEKRKPEQHPKGHGGTKVAKASGPPVIEHRKPNTQPPENKDFTVRMKIHSESPVAVSLLLMRQQGMAGLNNVKLNHGDGDSYDGTIPAAQAKGTVEYFIVAKNDAGQVTRLGDGDPKAPFILNFKRAAEAPAAQANAGPYVFTANPPYRLTPGKAISLRAQVVPTADDGTLPDRVVLLWRGNDAQDQMSDMQPDATGGYGGYRVDLPAQSDEGAVFYQFVACDSSGSKCGIDTGSKHKWHATAIASQPGGAPPMQPDAASSRAPASLPE